MEIADPEWLDILDNLPAEHSGTPSLPSDIISFEIEISDAGRSGIGGLIGLFVACELGTFKGRPASERDANDLDPLPVGVVGDSAMVTHGGPCG
mmetsp:Transcript_27659/g.38202  ORF Transcript_27659/g.38202 Transcript_27659/m.38202 type:complete len:94 (+) Transcript_27659:642-923(+)